MNPRRFVEQYPVSLEAQLLRAGRAMRPPASTQHRVLAVLGLATSTIATTAEATTHAVGSKGVWLARGLLLKWGGIGLASTALVGGSVALLRYRQHVSTTLHVPESVSPTGGSLPAAPATHTSSNPESFTVTDEAHAAAPLEPSSRRAKSSVAPQKNVDSQSLPQVLSQSRDLSLGAEVASIDAIRRALDSQQAGQALRLLDEHARRFTSPRLAQEAAYLRIRASRQVGRDSDTKKQVERLRDESSASPPQERR